VIQKVHGLMSQGADEKSSLEEIDLIRTKLAPHRAARGLLDRPELIERLEAGAENPLALLRAPAGFGKTTLAGQWRQVLIGRGCDVVWISLDPDDADETQFLAYFLAALEGKGEVAKGALSLHRRGTNLKALATALSNDLSGIETPLYIFLDDYHHVTSDMLNGFLQELILTGPPNVHFVLTTRSEPQLNLAELRFRNLITEIGIEDLRFGFAEAQAFFTEHSKGSINSQQVQSVLEATDGWVTAMQWVTIALRREPDAEGLLNNPKAGTAALVETIASDTLDAMPDALEEFLLMTSVLERFNADLCKAVTGYANSADILHRLEAENLFVLPVEGEPDWFRYHPLFASHLRERLIRRYVDDTRALGSKLDQMFGDNAEGADLEHAMATLAHQRASIDVFELHRRAAYWYQSRGYVVQAVRHALSAGDSTMMLDLMEGSAMDLIEQGELHTLIAWHDRVDRATLKRRPSLVLAFGWAFALTCQLDKAEDMAALFLEIVDADDPDADYQVEVLKGAMNAFRDRFKDTLRLRDVLEREGTAFSAAAGHNVLAFGYTMMGDYQTAKDVLDRYENDDAISQSYFPSIYRDCLRGLCFAFEGQFARAEAYLTTTLEKAERQYGRRSTGACVLVGALASVFYETNQIARAERILANRLDVLNDSVFPDGIIRANATAMRVHYLKGKPALADEVFEACRDFGERTGFTRVSMAVHYERLRHYVARGDLEAAEAELDDIEQLAPKNGFDRFDTEGEIALLASCARAHVLLAQHKFKHARALLDDLVRDYAGINRRNLHAGLNLLLGVALDGEGREQDALTHISRALQIGERAGMKRTFLDEMEFCRPLIEQIAKAPDQPAFLRDYAQHLLEADRQVDLEPAPRRAPRPGAAEIRVAPLSVEGISLSEREHEILELLAQGMPNKRIALVLNISVETVKWHLKSLYLKLEVSSRLHAVDKARAMHLI